MPKFIFVRHGQSQANLTGLISVDETPITPLGIEQARKTAQDLKDMGIKTIVSSPYLRARQTAEAIARELGIDPNTIEIVEELAERSLGDLKGKPKRHDNQYFYEADGEYGLEPRITILKRMHRAIEKIEKVADQKGTVLAVGHAVSGYYLIEAAKNKNDLESLDPAVDLANAEFVEIEFDSRGITTRVEVE